MHILLTSQYFPPETGALASRSGDHVRRWVQAGARVTVLAGQPNYPTGRVPSAYRGRRFVDEEWNGARVLRVPVLTGRYDRSARRVGNYVSYAASAFVAGALWANRPDLVIGSSPPPTAALAGLLVAARFRVPFVLEERDPWPESLLALDVERPPGAIAALRQLTRSLRRGASHVVVVTPEMRDALVQEGFPPSQVTSVPNGIDTSRFRHEGKPASLRLGEEPLLGHVGTMGHGQDLDTLIDAVATLPNELPFRVLLMGDGVLRHPLEKRAARETPGRFVFLDPLPHADIPGVLRALDVAIVSSRWSAHCDRTVPAKLYEAMACARPVLLAGRGAAASLVERSGSGVVVAPGDPERLAAALSAMLSDADGREAYGRTGAKYAREHHDRDVLAARLLAIVQEVSSDPSCRGFW